MSRVGGGYFDESFVRQRFDQGKRYIQRFVSVRQEGGIATGGKQKYRTWPIQKLPLVRRALFAHVGFDRLHAESLPAHHTVQHPN